VIVADYDPVRADQRIVALARREITSMSLEE